MSNKFKRHETEVKINVHAWKNPEFKKKLLTHPAAALEEMGMKNIPGDIDIKIVKEEKKQWCIVLHEPLAGYETLSEQQLEKIAAGCVIVDPSWPGG